MSLHYNSYLIDSMHVTFLSVMILHHQLNEWHHCGLLAYDDVWGLCTRSFLVEMPSQTFEVRSQVCVCQGRLVGSGPLGLWAHAGAAAATRASAIPSPVPIFFAAVGGIFLPGPGGWRWAMNVDCRRAFLVTYLEVQKPHKHKIYACIHTYNHTFIHTYIHTFIHTHIHT